MSIGSLRSTERSIQKKLNRDRINDVYRKSLEAQLEAVRIKLYPKYLLISSIIPPQHLAGESNAWRRDRYEALMDGVPQIRIHMIYRDGKLIERKLTGSERRRMNRLN